MPQQVSRSAALFVVCVAHFLMPFMMSAVGVALPAMGREFGASAMQLGLVETTYVLSASIFLLAMGRLGDIHGRRRVFQAGIAVFTLIGGALSQAWSIEAVIGLRFLQGMGGSMVMATTMAIVVSVFPPEERGKALGIAIASVYAGISCGPFIGGALVSTLGWRSLFYLCVPLGVITYLISRAKLRAEWAEAKGEPFDWQGSLIYAASILLLIAGASNLDHGPWAWLLMFCGLAGVGAFLAFEGRTPYPVLNVALLRRNRVFALSNLAALFNYAATFGVTFFLSLYLQYVKGMDPHQAGSVLIVQPIAQTLLSPLCGRLADRIPAGRVATAGMALCAAGLGIAASISASTPLAVILTLLVFLGMGFALFSSPNVSVIMGSVEPRYLGVASGLNSSMRTLGMMTSMTIITVIFSVFMGGHAVTAATQDAFLRSMQTALTVFCGLCLLGIFCSLGRLGGTPSRQQQGGPR
ncbi:MFS transporter [Desulfuromonas versatilis]|uniref:MFS transporter n=1 Tax=Desulfuromonas versatilis TaxID=2802975 RepID=A0ABM8HNI9_9BACT|nr:MFS transporter [Desulfuromonas versatilis]BCR02990.1 MFS transporter [Desulfuromonas versatilis]